MELNRFVLNLPTSKTVCCGNTYHYLNYLHQHFHLTNRRFDLECQRSTRHKRWRSYIHKYKTLDRYCKRLFNDENKTNTVVAYGDASFCHTSKGHLPSLKGNWIKHRLEKIHNIHVLMTKEHNSSQVCSACHHNKKLTGLGSKRDPTRYLYNYADLRSKHFVRRCTNCLMIWQRDINASNNMITIARRVVARQERHQLEHPDEIEFDGTKTIEEQRNLLATHKRRMALHLPSNGLPEDA